MSTTQHTGHYNLPTFGDNPNDRPSWRGDFTDAMTKIDNQMYTNATNITTATAAANNATTAAGEAKTAAEEAKDSADSAAGLAQTNKTDIAKLDGYFNALGVTSLPTAQNLMSNINGKAENTDLTALQGTVSSLQGTVNGKANTSDVYTKSQADTTFTKQGGYSGTAQQLNQRITEVDNKIHGFMPWRKTYDNIVIVGDSITHGTKLSSTAKSWGNLFKDYIGAESVQNLAQDNAGFVNAPTFLSQLQSASNKEAVTHVIIAGGANDKRTADAQVTTAVVNTLKYALENFPNATIHVAPVMLGVQGIFRYDLAKSNVWSTLNAIEAGIAQVPNVHEIRYAWEWLNGRQDWASTSGGTLDTIHPNDTGQQQLLRLMAESLFTENSIHNNWSVGVSGADNHGNIAHSSSTCSNGVYDFSAQVTMVNNHQAYQGIVKTCYGLSMANNFHVNASYTAGNVYASVDSSNMGLVSCTTNIPNNTEIYMTAHHYIGA